MTTNRTEVRRGQTPPIRRGMELLSLLSPVSQLANSRTRIDHSHPDRSSRCYKLRCEEISNCHFDAGCRRGDLCARPTAPSGAAGPADLHILRVARGGAWQFPNTPKLQDDARRVR